MSAHDSGGQVSQSRTPSPRYESATEEDRPPRLSEPLPETDAILPPRSRREGSGSKEEEEEEDGEEPEEWR
eukprot:COSAG01_NODE_36237_length_520_cov_1.021378_1_plen_70_part_10